tara:strand:- start:999 stop:2069 length:1071 start_codon:yes stop_codon:yes gene_type:complete
MSEHILSASRIKTFESCSWKYWCGYVLKMPKLKNDGNVRGTACHLILEVLLNPRHKKYIKKILKAETIKAVPSVEKLVQKSIRRDGEEFYSQENLELCDKWILVGLKLDFLGGKSGGKIKEPEKHFLLDTFDIEGKPNYKITGFIDKPIEYKSKGKLKLVDYKTNSKIFAPAEIDYNPQAFAYLLAAKEIWPKLTETSIEFQFLKFPEEPIVEIKYSDAQLEGFEYYLEHLYNLFNNFTEKDARNDFAKDKGFPKDDEGFAGRLNCGFADYPGDRKKNGDLKWHCQYKFAHDYYAVVNADGEVLYSSMNKKDLHPKKGEKIEKKHYAGCPAWPNLNLSDQKQKEQEKSEDLGEFPF